MSKHESWRTRQFWQTIGGLLIEEFQLVQATPDGNTARRLVDGLIVIDEEQGIQKGATYDIRDKDVIVVQTKATRLGMYLMGQALFSRELVQTMGPRSVRTVAICSKGDGEMLNLCDKHGIEVVVIP